MLAAAESFFVVVFFFVLTLSELLVSLIKVFSMLCISVLCTDDDDGDLPVAL